MRLLMLAQFFPPDIGGEERHVLNLATTLADRGHEVAVATQWLPGTAEREVIANGVRVHRFRTTMMGLPAVYSTDRPHHPPLPDPAAVRALARIVAEERPDVLHAHNWIVNSALPLRRRRPDGGRIGLVLTLHDYSHVCATKRLMRDGQICPGPRALDCLRCATAHYGPAVGVATALATTAVRPWKDHAVDHVVSVSHAVAVANGVPPGPHADVVPNFVPDTALDVPDPGTDTTDATGLPEGDFLLYVGDLSREKGVDTLLEAYRRVRAEVGPTTPDLLLVGRRTPTTPAPADLPAGAALAHDWPHPRVLAAFRRCLVAVLPSVWPDPCPTTVLEAMATGRPVVSTRVGGIVDQVEHEVSGLLVPPADVAGLATAVGRLVRDPALRERLGAGAAERVRAFTASSVAARLEEIYAKVARA